MYTLFQIMISHPVIRPPGYIQTLGGIYLQDPVNLGNLAWGLGQLSGTRQSWVLYRAGVYLTAKQNAALHPTWPNQQINVAIRHAMSTSQAKASGTQVKQSWHTLARCVRMRSYDRSRTHLVRQSARQHHVPSAFRPPLSRREGGLWPLTVRTLP